MPSHRARTRIHHVQQRQQRPANVVVVVSRVRQLINIWIYIYNVTKAAIFIYSRTRIQQRQHCFSPLEWHNPPMIQITAQIENELANMAGDQLPFVTSLALNRTAVESRDLVRGNLPLRFKLRNNWTRNGIQAKTSTKNNLVAVVSAPGYMQIQETGGTRTPTKTKLLAAPTDAIKGNRVTPKSKKPGALLADRAFIIDMKNGDAGVFIRYGKKRGQIRLLWWLSEDQDYKEKFEFEKDVEDYVQDRFSANFRDAMVEAMKTGGYAKIAKKGRKRIDRPAGMSARAFRRAQSRS